MACRGVDWQSASHSVPPSLVVARVTPVAFYAWRALPWLFWLSRVLSRTRRSHLTHPARPVGAEDVAIRLLAHTHAAHGPMGLSLIHLAEIALILTHSLSSTGPRLDILAIWLAPSDVHSKFSSLSWEPSQLSGRGTYEGVFQMTMAMSTLLLDSFGPHSPRHGQKSTEPGSMRAWSLLLQLLRTHSSIASASLKLGFWIFKSRWARLK
ncbi:hypothetical protein B0O80DRAFT_430027 [Mortierella sp. GBAus27b]|nr:hypothetical protein B0O80DRAFT_430027 [Mortierella sp. GBAus27b]